MMYNSGYTIREAKECLNEFAILFVNKTKKIL